MMKKSKTYQHRANQVVQNERSKVKKQLNDQDDNAQGNEMRVNRKKTNVMLFNDDKKHDFTPTFTINNELPEVTDEIKLLGFKVTNNLKWNLNTKYITTVAYSMLWMLKRIKNLWASRAELVNCYTKQTRSVLEYCSVVWHTGLTQINATNIEPVQKAACGIILGKAACWLPGSSDHI